MSKPKHSVLKAVGDKYYVIVLESAFKHTLKCVIVSDLEYTSLREAKTDCKHANKPYDTPMFKVAKVERETTLTLVE